MPADTNHSGAAGLRRSPLRRVKQKAGGKRKVRRRGSKKCRGSRKGFWTSLRCVFWNARGMTDKFHDTIAFLEHTGSSIGCISETRLYGKGNKQYGKWKYIRGPECLPAIGVTTARLGLGMLVNTERFPDADVILHTKYTQWTALAGEATPVFVGVCYVPCGPEADRQEAYDDMEEAIARFENLGRVIIGGDFNARCGLNGDRLTNTAGRNLVNFCSQNALTMINSMPATTGKFSRIQRVVLNGTVTV